MRNAFVLPVLAGIVVTVGAGLGLLAQGPAFGTVLDGFSINTQDKAVTVTLYTDQRAQYTTENHGKQFAIVLPDVQLSPEQINNGLPVVIDNKNRFIGRAVPTEDGKVKIILPNLPASEYSVSIQQKRPSQAVDAGESTVITKPRAAVQAPPKSTFEDIAAKFPKPSTSVVPTIAPGNSTKEDSLRQASSGSSVIRLSSAPETATSQANNGQIWNPYVVSVPSPNKTAYSNYKPVSPRQRTAHVPPPIHDVPLSSLAESDAAPKGMPDAQNIPVLKDPLWYLNSLPPADLNHMPFDDLSGLAKEGLFMPTVDLIPEANQPAPIEKDVFSGLKEAVLSLPWWLLTTVAVFFGGIGLFTMVGGLVLLRLLFTQVRQGHIGPAVMAPTLVMAPSNGMVSGMPAGTAFPNQPPAEPVSPKSPYATVPEPRQITFEDKAAVDTLDYLKRTPDNVSKAVHNSVLVKFPAHRNRTARRRGTASPRKAAAFTS